MVTAIAGIGECRNTCRAERPPGRTREHDHDPDRGEVAGLGRGRGRPPARDDDADGRRRLRRAVPAARLEPRARPHPRRPQRGRDGQPARLGPHRHAHPGLREPRAAQRRHRGRGEAVARRDPRGRRRVVGPAGVRGARTMPEQAWTATVGSPKGEPMPASEILWLRAKEVWIHAVDLDAGASFADLPRPMLHELLTDVAGTFAARPDFPRLLLVPTDEPRTWAVGEGEGATEVRGPVAELAAWLVGRSKGRNLRTAQGTRPPKVLPPGSSDPGPSVTPTSPPCAPSSRCPPASRPPCSPRPRRPRRPARPGSRPGRRHRRRAGDDRPAGSKDLDQAVGVVARGDGFRVHYAIADLGAVVAPGRGAGRRGAPPRADRLPARRRGAAAPAGAVRGRREPAARRAARRRAVADRPRRRGRAGGGGRAPGRRRVRARLDYAGVQADVDAGRIHPAIAALPVLGPLRRALAVRARGDRAGAARAGGGRPACDARAAAGRSSCVGAPPSRTGTPRSRCSPACPPPG